MIVVEIVLGGGWYSEIFVLVVKGYGVYYVVYFLVDFEVGYY